MVTRRTGSVIVALALGACGVRGGGADDASSGALARIAADFPAARALVADARQGSAREADGGVALRARSGLTPIAARVPRTADAPIAIDAMGATLRARRVGASEARARIESGAAVYDAAWPGVDAVVFARGAALEELLAARGTTLDVAYDVELPAGWRLVRPLGAPWDVEARDAGDVPRARFTARRAWDGRGADARVALEIDGRRVTLHARGDAGPLLVDPAWEPAGQMAVARGSAALLPLPDGKILVGGGDGLSPNSVLELYDPVAATFTLAATLAANAYFVAATVMPDARALLVLVDDNGSGSFDLTFFDPVTGKLTPGPAFSAQGRVMGAVTLPSGEVFVLVAPNAYLFDPKANAVSAAGAMIGNPPVNTTNAWGTYLLPSGKVLAYVGGSPPNYPDAELWDPATKKFSLVPWGGLPIDNFTSTVLPSGRVLFVGLRYDGNGYATASGVFDPSTGMPSAVGTLPTTRTEVALTVLPSGDVLAAGGSPWSAQGPQATAEVELFDPRTGAFRPAAPMATPRAAASSVLLPSGDVLVVGGMDDHGSSLQTAERYAPQELRGASIAAPATLRNMHTATTLADGRVLLAGGASYPAFATSLPVVGLATAEAYDPATSVFSIVAQMSQPRMLHGAGLLASGDVLLAGGYGAITTSPTGALATAEIYRASSSRIVSAGAMTAARAAPAVTPLADGTALVTGGLGASGQLLASAETFDPSTGAFSATATPMATPRAHHAAVRMPSGRVLLAGGAGGSTAAEIYDPSTRSFTPTSAMHAPRDTPAMVLLPSGKVLVAAGDPPGPPMPPAPPAPPPMPTNTAELYDETTGTFTLSTSATTVTYPPGTLITATLTTTREVLLKTDDFNGEVYDPARDAFSALTPTVSYGSIAAPLPSGDVLVYGRQTSSDSPSATDPRPMRWQPGTGAFTPIASSVQARLDATATALPNGDVLVAGGLLAASNPATNAVQLFREATHDAVSAPPLLAARGGHTATLLPDGRVLLAGGTSNGVTALASTELYDPATGAFTHGPSMLRARMGHSATTLASGLVLFAGGGDALQNGGHPAALADAELFDPASGAFRATGSLVEARAAHAAVLLPSGNVLIAGGTNYVAANPMLPAVVESAEIYDPSTGKFTATSGLFPLQRGVAVASARGPVFLAGGPLLSFTEAGGPQRIAASDAVALVGLLDGSIAACGLTSCTAYAPSGAASSAFLPSNGETPDTTLAIATPAGSVFAASGSAQVSPTSLAWPSTRYMWWDPLPQGVVRPIVDGVPPSVAPGAPVTLHGSGFTRSPARGTSGAPRTDIVPSVVFSPADGSAPIPSDVAGWTDTTIAWIPPRTVHRGAGWVHVVVQGVPSVGAFTSLRGAPSGAACAADVECAGSVCADGVCCDRACGACESCRAADQAPGGADGVCGAVTAGTDPHDVCPSDAPHTCGRTGDCDGRGACGREPDGTTCGVGGACAGGACTIVPICADEVTATSAGAETACSPYRCRAGACLTFCASSVDCAPGSACQSDGRCGPPFDAAPPPDPGACAVRAGAADHDARAPWLLLGAAALALGARARRRPRAR